MSEISKRLVLLQRQVRQACIFSGRNIEDVNILAVTKSQPTSSISAALEAGQHHFGENYLQEALPKLTSAPSPNWHFIGAIQSNKTKDIAQNFDWVHSVDSLKVAKRLSDQRPMCLNPLKVMIQINISEESGKAGLPPEATLKLASEITALPNLCLQGLMVIPALSDSFEKQRQYFRNTREIRDYIAEILGIQLPHLSMGMTDDFKAAIIEGSTWIRIGKAIFGPRTYSGDKK